ncbi:MAG: nucleotidyltransferase family protein [Clostridia bacterium]|nr:nucleotidyltransferase family protein [Clostridia bacterium]
MKTVAIICEYNPLTNGHIRHLMSARRETGCDTVVCVMSGSFVQRGEAAILDKYQRAELAVSFGADMVVELPLLYAISPADNFAYGAIKTVSALPNVEYVSFGSECGDVALLQKAADFLFDEPDEYKEFFANRSAEGNSFPKARALALHDYAEKNPEYADIAAILDSPNNTLGIAYITAIKKAGLNIKIHTVKREESDNDLSMDTEYPTASAVREALRFERFDQIEKAVHPLCLEKLKNTHIDYSVLDNLCLYKMKEVNGYDLADYYEVNEGLNNRLKLAAMNAVHFSDFINEAKTKRYTMAKIKRISLYTLFDITKQFYEESTALPPYLFVLALSKARKDILSEATNTCKNVLLRYSDINKADKSLRAMLKLDFRAQGVLALINKTADIRRSFVLV